MIITEAVSSPVLTSVVSAPSRFKIKASAKAFKILSGFYSEPILAIPRELGANAWDSHVKAGNTKQMFEVHAPNTLEDGTTQDLNDQTLQRITVDVIQAKGRSDGVATVQMSFHRPTTTFHQIAR